MTTWQLSSYLLNTGSFLLVQCLACAVFLVLSTDSVYFFREKFIRLQHENKMLRVQQEEFEQEKIAALQTQLEEADKACSELKTENRLTVF